MPKNEGKQQGQKGQSAGKGRAGFSYALPGGEEREYRNPGEFWQAVRNETGQDPDTFAKQQGFEDSDAFLRSVRGRDEEASEGTETA